MKQVNNIKKLMIISTLGLIFCVASLFTYLHVIQTNKALSKTVVENPKIRSQIEQADLLYKKAETYYANADYENASKCYTQSAEIFKLTSNWHSYANSMLKMADYYQLKCDFTKAQSCLNQTDSVLKLKISHNDVVFSELYNKLATGFLFKAEYSKSISLLNKSLAIREKAKISNDSSLSTVYNLLGANYYSLGQYGKALGFYQRALNTRLSICKSKNDKETAKYYNNIGLLYQRKGDFEKAFIHLKKSLQIKELLYPANDPLKVKAYLNIGSIYQEMGNYDTALAYINKAEKIALSNADYMKSLIAIVYVNKGNLFLAIGDYAKSLQYMLSWLSKSNSNKNSVEASQIYNNISYAYFNLKDYKAALQYSQMSVAIREKHDLPLLARSYNNLARCYELVNDDKNAQKYYEKAIVFAEKYFGNKHKDLALCYQNYANFCVKNDNQSKALHYYQLAYNIYVQSVGKRNIETAKCIQNIGDLYYKMQDLGTALTYYQQSIIALMPKFSSANLYNNPDIKNEKALSHLDLVEVMSKKANALGDLFNNKTHNINDLKASLSSYKEAIALVDITRRGIVSEESKLSLAENEKKIYKNSIVVALELYNKTNNNTYQEIAFEIAEKSKANVLYELVRDNEAKHYASIPDSVLNQEKTLKSEIALYENKINEERSCSKASMEKINLWEEKIFQLQHQQDKLVTQLEEDYPQYYQYKYDDKTYGASDVQGMLKPNQALVEYFIDGKTLYAFCITKSSLRSTVASVDSNFFNGIYSLSNGQALDKILNDANKSFQAYTSNSYLLYQSLLEPFKSEIAGKNLIIVPDEQLGYLSFESLITKKVSTKKINYRDLPYLIRECAINYSYSSTLLINSYKTFKHKPAKEDLLAFAPANFTTKNTAPKDQLAQFRTRSGNDLSNLPGTIKEVNNIHKIISGKVYTDSMATKSNFLKVASNYKILHIATHGTVDNINPMYSNLAFYPNKGSQDEGYLNTYELFNMRLNADLAVLSACNTGSGKNARGEGLMTLARGFLYAGVPSLVISLWNINDQSSADIMEGFYGYLKQGLNKDEALRRAKLDYLINADNIHSHPYFWSGFINIGNNKPIHFGNPYAKLYWLLLVIIPLGVVAAYKKRQIKSC